MFGRRPARLVGALVRLWIVWGWRGAPVAVILEDEIENHFQFRLERE
jgi:hypothetical protein